MVRGSSIYRSVARPQKHIYIISMSEVVETKESMTEEMNEQGEENRTTAETQEVPILKREVGGKLGEHCIMEATRRSEWSTISNGIALKFLINMNF